MKKLVYSFLGFCFLFLSSKSAMSATTVLGLTLSKEALIFSSEEKVVSFSIFNNTSEPQDYFLSLAPLVLEGGKYVEYLTEKKFLDSLSLSPGKVVKGVPPKHSQTITIRLEVLSDEDHQVILFVRQALKKKNTEQTEKMTAGARNVPNIGIQVIFLAKKDQPKGTVILDLVKKKIQITRISRSFLYGELSVIGIAEGKEEVLSKFNLFVRNDRWIDLSPDFSKFGKIRIKYIEYGGKNVILDQTLSIFGRGFISLYGNNTLVSSDFPCFMKESGVEILVDAREFISALGFYSEEQKGVICGTIFGKFQWFEISNGTASNYNTSLFKLSSSFYGLLTVEELAKIFGLDVEYNRWGLYLSVRTRKREKFAFQVIDDLKGKMKKTEQEPEKRGRDSATKIFCLAADYSLYNQNNENNICGAHLNYATNIYNFSFSGEQIIDDNNGSQNGSQLVNKKLAYFNEKFNFQTNLGEINRLSQSPFSRFCGIGNGIEIFSLPKDDKFQIKGGEILPPKRDDEVAGCWFSNNQYFDQNSTIFFHRGTNPVLHHYLNKCGEEIRDYRFFAIPQNHPGEGKFSFYAGGLREEDGERYFYNARLDYGLEKNVISVGKADAMYLSFVSPLQYFILDGISELREKPRYRANLSTLNLKYVNLSLNASREEEAIFSLKGEARIGGRLGIANSFIIKEEKEIVDRLSFSFSPYRRINCSAAFEMNDNIELDRSNYSVRYSFRRHRFNASLHHILNSYFSRLGYDYKIRQLNFNVDIGGENFERIYCSVFYFFEYGQMFQSSYYNTETKKWSNDSRFSGSVIMNGSNINFCSESSMRQSKILVLIFMDKNFNGVFEENIDKPLKEAKITVDGKSSKYFTSEKGTAWIKISTPSKSLIGADDATLPPHAFAGEPVLIKVSAPISMKVEIPVYLGGEIMGVDTGDDVVEIWLLNKSGVQIAKTDVYSDGIFYFNKIIPGDYILIAGERRKEVEIKVDENGEPVSVLDVIIK